MQRHDESGRLVLPQITALAPWGGLSGALAALRTCDDLLSRPGGVWGCGAVMRPYVSDSAPPSPQVVLRGDKGEGRAWVSAILTGKEELSKHIGAAMATWLRKLNSCQVAGCEHRKLVRGFCAQARTRPAHAHSCGMCSTLIARTQHA